MGRDMNEIAILEDGIELIAAADNALYNSQAQRVKAAADQWKEITGRDHPGRWGTVEIRPIGPPDRFVTGPIFEYHDWRVVYYSDYFYLQRLCLNCRAWSLTWMGPFCTNRIKYLKNISEAYSSSACKKRKCKKAITK